MPPVYSSQRIVKWVLEAQVVVARRAGLDVTLDSYGFIDESAEELPKRGDKEANMAWAKATA